MTDSLLIIEINWFSLSISSPYVIELGTKLYYNDYKVVMQAMGDEFVILKQKYLSNYIFVKIYSNKYDNYAKLYFVKYNNNILLQSVN